MIIHSTTLDTMEKVIAIYGGVTWKKIEGRFLLGSSSSYAVDSTGGSATNILTTANLPSHSHGIPALSGTAKSSGAHVHQGLSWYGNKNITLNANAPTMRGILLSYSDTAGINTSDYNKIYTNNAGAHEHTVTTSASNTNATGSGSSINNMPPYKTVYIWERTA